jgi:hypothetical protein
MNDVNDLFPKWKEVLADFEREDSGVRRYRHLIGACGQRSGKTTFEIAIAKRHIGALHRWWSGRLSVNSPYGVPTFMVVNDHVGNLWDALHHWLQTLPGAERRGNNAFFFGNFLVRSVVTDDIPGQPCLGAIVPEPAWSGSSDSFPRILAAQDTMREFMKQNGGPEPITVALGSLRDAAIDDPLVQMVLTYGQRPDVKTLWAPTWEMNQNIRRQDLELELKTVHGRRDFALSS